MTCEPVAGESVIQTPICIVGDDAHLASETEIRRGIRAATEVFARNNADPLACAEARRRRDKEELLTREDALRSVIWDEADDAAWRAITVGWLSRNVDIRIAVD